MRYLLVGKTRGAALASLLCLLGTSACDAFFGIKEGQPAGIGGSGSTGDTTNTGGIDGTGGTTGSTGGTGGSGAGGQCAGSAALDGQTTKWVARAVGGYVDKGLAIAKRSSGELVVAGSYADNDFVVDLKKLPYPTHADEPAEQENIFVAQYGEDGKPDWSIGFAGRDLQRVTGIATDNLGYAVVGGYFLNAFQVGSSTLTADGQLSSLALDGFVFKLDFGGNPLWAKQFGGASTDEVVGVAVDSLGDIVVLGVSILGGDIATPPESAPANFGCDPRTLQKNVPTVFLTKLNKDGDCVWDRQYEIDTRFYGLYNPAVGLALAVDPKDNIIVAGGFAGVTNFGGGVSIIATGSKDVFLLKSDPNGEPLWAASYGDENLQAASVVATDPDGDIWIGGSYQQSVTLGSLPKQTDPLADPNYQKAFVAKLELDALPTKPATPVFLKAFSDTGWQFVRSLAVNADGDAVFGGNLYGLDGATGVDFGDGNRLPAPGKDANGNYHDDGFVAKYCKSGGLRWAKRLSTTGTEEVHGVALDDKGNTYVTGSFEGAYDFGGSQEYPSVSQDVFTLRIGPQ